MINKNFTLLLAGQLVSQVGDKLHMMALAFWVLQTTGSAAKMGMVLAASMVPSLVFGFFSGAVIDRYNRKILIVGTDVFRGGIIAGFTAFFYAEIKMEIPLNFYAILLMQILLSVNAAFFDPAIPSIIPQIVSEKNLAAANSRYQFVASFSMIAGAFWGGILISSIGYAWVFVANAASFLISAFFECFVQIPALPKPFPSRKKLGIWTTLGQGYRYIFSARPLLLLLFMVMAIHFFVGSVEVFMPVIANDISRDGARVLGFFQAVLGVGSLAMAMLSGFLPISGNERSWLFGSVFCMGGLFCTGFFFRGNEFELTGLFLWMMGGAGGCIISASIAFKTLLQKIVDNAYAGRVFAVAGSVGNASIPGAMLFYGGLLDKVAFQPLLLGTGLILMLLTSVLFMLYREKHHDREQKITT